MRHIGFGQLLVLLLLCFLLFGDFNKVKTKLLESSSAVFSFFSKNFRKKGS
jgi:Sec-independent protein translocase protein TatA